MTDTPETDAMEYFDAMCDPDRVVESGFARKLERERDMYERQVTCLLERLGKTQELMIDAERGKQNSNKREFTLPYINTNQND